MTSVRPTAESRKASSFQNGAAEIEQALSTLMNYSVVPVKSNEEMEVPAFYDEHSMELYVNPNYSTPRPFAAIAAEVAHSRFHAKGVNQFYSRGMQY